jgi:hypothetical protein
LFERVAHVILLFNYALMRPEPVAQIVFAVSAVQSLGQDESWSHDQKQLLRELASTRLSSRNRRSSVTIPRVSALTLSLRLLELRNITTPRVGKHLVETGFRDGIPPGVIRCDT